MHKYAKEMMAMAEAAKTSETPWDVLEVKSKEEPEWWQLTFAPRFEQKYWQYRIKPKEKKKLWLWHYVDKETNEAIKSKYFVDAEIPKSINAFASWHKTNTFIEIEV